jgi:channel protein (hemolysin III family)
VIDTYPIAGFAEPVSSWSHLGGAGVFLWVSVRVARAQRESVDRCLALAVFAFATVLQLTVSGVYHLLDVPGPSRPVLQQLDHAAIFVLIAGTLTAVHGLLFTGAWRRNMILAAWTMCAIGICFKTAYFEETAEWLGLLSYFCMGLLGLFTTVKLWTSYGASFALPLLLGGLVYTVGAVCDFLREPVLVKGVLGPHEILHLCVLVALALHWRFLARAVDMLEDNGTP